MRTSTRPVARPSSSRPGRRPGRRAGSTRTTSRPRSPTWSSCSRTSCRATRSWPTAPSGGGSPPSGTPAGTRATSCCWATPPTRRTSRWARAPSWRWRTPSRWRRRSSASASVPAALASYEAGRRPQVESLQRAAQASLEWFESVERYHDTEPLQFAFNLLTRSLRITHENLRLRDPALVAQVDRWFAEQAGEAERAPGAASIPALRRCSRPTGSASWCCPTGSWSPPCASTGRTTGCRTIGTWCTSAAGRSAAPDW